MLAVSGEDSSYRHIGPHRVRIEGPDVLHIRLFGDIELEHFRAFFDIIEHDFPLRTRCYVLRDARYGGIVKPNARTYISKDVDNSRVAALVTYGGSFQSRTVLSMIGRALRSVHPTTHTPDTLFFNTHDEAMSWIKQHRAANQQANILTM